MIDSNSCTTTTLKWSGAVAIAGALLLCPARGKAQSESPTPVQIVSVDECDPTTFYAACGGGAHVFKNVTVDAFKAFDGLKKAAMEGTPDPGWDFEADK